MKLAAARQGRKNLFDKIRRLLNQGSNCLGDDVDLMMHDDTLRLSCECILKMQDDY